MDEKKAKLEELVQSLKNQKDWLEEINRLSELLDELDGLNKVVSVRGLASVLNRPKTWVGVSLMLVKGLKLYPEIAKCPNRNTAYEFLQKKNKLKRFLES